MGERLLLDVHGYSIPPPSMLLTVGSSGPSRGGWNNEDGQLKLAMSASLVTVDKTFPGEQSYSIQILR